MQNANMEENSWDLKIAFFRNLRNESAQSVMFGKQRFYFKENMP